MAPKPRSVLLCAAVFLSSMGTTDAYGERIASWFNSVKAKVAGIGGGNPAFSIPNTVAVQAIYKGYQFPDKWGYKFNYNMVRNPNRLEKLGASKCWNGIKSWLTSPPPPPLLQSACGDQPGEMPCGPQNWQTLPDSSICLFTLPQVVDQSPINIPTASSLISPAWNMPNATFENFGITYNGGTCR